MKIWNARAVHAKCAELSTFEKINIQLFIFHWETNSILGSRSERKAQVLVDLSKNTSMALEVNFLFATRISIGFYHNLLSFISDHGRWIMTCSEWIWINLYDKNVGPHFKNCRQIWNQPKYIFTWRFGEIVKNKKFFVPKVNVFSMLSYVETIEN